MVRGGEDRSEDKGKNVLVLDPASLILGLLLLRHNHCNHKVAEFVKTWQVMCRQFEKFLFNGVTDKLRKHAESARHMFFESFEKTSDPKHNASPKSVSVRRIV